MSLFEVLQESEVSQRLTAMGREPKLQFRFFEPIKVRRPRLRLSVQGSYGVYCRPPVTLVDPKDYKAMEIALLGCKERFVFVEEVISDEKLIQELNVYRQDSVYAYVPIPLIERLYEALMKKEEKTNEPTDLHQT